MKKILFIFGLVFFILNQSFSQVTGVNAGSFGFANPADSLNFVTATTKVNGVGVWKKVNLGQIKNYVNSELFNYDSVFVEKVENNNAFFSVPINATLLSAKYVIANGSLGSTPFPSYNNENLSATAYPFLNNGDYNFYFPFSQVDFDNQNLSGIRVYYKKDKFLTTAPVTSVNGQTGAINTWAFNGNAIENGSFIGTTNNQDLILKRNNFTVARFKSKLYDPNETGEFVESILIELGDNSTASGISTIAIGQNLNVSGDYATGIGQYSSSTGGASVAIGFNSNANSSGALSLGTGSQASANQATAIGFGSAANGFNSIALGGLTNGNESIAIGTQSMANGNGSMAIGNGSYATNLSSVAIGVTNNKWRESITLGISNDTTGTAGLYGSLTDRLFQLGNGNGGVPSLGSEFSNAITVLRNGNTSIGSNYAPTEKLEVSGRIKAENIRLDLSKLPIRASQAAAADLEVGDVYRTATGDLKIKY